MVSLRIQRSAVKLTSPLLSVQRKPLQTRAIFIYHHYLHAMELFAEGLSLNRWIFALLLWTSAGAFNLDTQNVLRKNGQPGSLFGFALALHRQLQPTDKRM